MRRGHGARPPGTRPVAGWTCSSATGTRTRKRTASLTARPADAARVAAALIAAVAPLRSVPEPVELSLTGGKDSRLVAAALVAAGVPVRAKTHGFPQHPDVVVAAEVARLLGIEHDVRTPATPEAKIDVATRLRATVLVADGMLSAFENVGRPDHSASGVVTAGGHGGELLRGGYAETAAGSRYQPGARGYAKRAARATELLRRLTSGHVALLRPGAAAGYIASLRPWSATALSHGPLQALDDFYLVNRAGRWSAAARQAYLLRENLVQPLFADGVVRAARAVPLADRVSGALQEAVLRELTGETGSGRSGSGPGRARGKERPGRCWPISRTRASPPPGRCPKRSTGGASTVTRWPASCAITPSTTGLSATCSRSSAGPPPRRRSPSRTPTAARYGRWPRWPAWPRATSATPASRAPADGGLAAAVQVLGLPEEDDAD